MPGRCVTATYAADDRARRTNRKTSNGSSITAPPSRLRTCRPAGGCPTPSGARSTSAGRRSRGTGRSTLPSCVMPIFSNRKISCIVMTSPSMPVISEMLVTLRDAVAQARLLDDELDGRRDLLAHRALRQVRRAHRDHRLDAGQRVARRVGVDGRQRSVVARVHRLQHVERFLAADLADDDAVGAHTQGVDHELPLADRRPCLRRWAAASRAAPRAPGAAAARPRPRW